MRSASASGSSLSSACAVVNMPRGAEAALQGVIFAEGGLQRAQRLVVRQALDGDDAGAFSLYRQHQAGADRGAVDNDRARAAGTVLATEMGSGQAQHLAQAISEVEAGLDLDHNGITVDA